MTIDDLGNYAFNPILNILINALSVGIVGWRQHLKSNVNRCTGGFKMYTWP